MRAAIDYQHFSDKKFSVFNNLQSLSIQRTKYSNPKVLDKQKKLKMLTTIVNPSRCNFSPQRGARVCVGF